MNSATMLTFQAARLNEMGQYDQARLVLLKALEIDPDHATALHLMGVVSLAAGRADQARPFVERAAVVSPQDPGVRNTLAAVCKAAGDMDGAMAAMQAAVDLAPDEPLYRLNLGGLLRDQGRHQEAVKAYAQVLRIDPCDVDAMRALARLGAVAEQTADALYWYDRLLEGAPGDIDAIKGKAEMLVLRNRPDLARRALMEGLRRQPGNFSLVLGLTQCLPYVYDGVEQIEATRGRALDAFKALLGETPKIADPLREGGATNFAWPYQGLDDKPVQDALAAVYLKAHPGLDWTAPRLKARGAGRAAKTLRVGFVSAFLGDHTIGRLNAGLILALAEQGVSVSVFSLSPPSTPLFEPLLSANLKVSWLPRRLDEARHLLGEAGMDVLYYTDIGMEPLSYFLAFARLAPVQCASWGHPHTTGIPNVDYFLSSRRVEREDAQADYSETLVRFTDVNLIYAKPPLKPVPLDREQLGVGAGETFYLCCQSLIKIHPDFDAMIGELLKKDKTGRVAFVEGRYPEWTAALRKRLAKTLGKKAISRVIFVPRMPRDRFLRLLATADVILDTPHFSGGNTALEAISVGTPYVTVEGRYMRGRMAAGLLRQVGMDDLVARGELEAVAIAAHLGGDPRLRKDISARMRKGLSLVTENRGMIGEMITWMDKALTNSPWSGK